MQKKQLKNQSKDFLKEQYNYFNDDLKTMNYCNGDIQKLHQKFQFQFKEVTDFNTLRYGSITDLTASLGNFNFYAAIADIKIKTNKYNKYNAGSNTLHCVKSHALITHIWIYAKDSYNFIDSDPDNSQYLGHWSKSSVIVVGASAIKSMVDKVIEKSKYKNLNRFRFEMGNDEFTLLKFVTTGDHLDSDVYYCVRNKDYIKWRERHQRGGDFVVYSDMMKIKLDAPVSIELDEVCF